MLQGGDSWCQKKDSNGQYQPSFAEMEGDEWVHPNHRAASRVIQAESTGQEA